MSKIIGIYAIPDCGTFQYPGFTHDHSICIMEDGVITDYLQLERYSGRKYDNRLPVFIDEMIDSGLVQMNSDDIIVAVNSFLGQSFISHNGSFRVEALSPQKIDPELQKTHCSVTRGWDRQEQQAFIISHELAHIGANLPFSGEFQENSLLIHFDGGASLSNFSAFVFKNGQLKLIEAHWQLSHLSKIFNDNALSFALINAAPGEHCSVPGKFMGFATLGTPRPEIIAWLKKNRMFATLWENKQPFFASAKRHFGWQEQKFDTHDPFLQDIAASLQAIFQEEFIAKLAQLQENFRCDYLYLAGGCALNIVMNTEILHKRLFTKIFIPPCSGDSGLSIGAAAYYSWRNGIRVQKQRPYLNSINCDLKGHYPNDQKLVRQLAKLIAAGHIIGIANGNGEVGPRALGNRSIICRPDSRELSQKLSMAMKGREWYRPIAPIMLEKHAKRYTGQSKIDTLSQYMLLDFQIVADLQHEIAGVVHRNGTARIQTIFQREDHPFMFDLLVELENHYGIFALINTSFNSRGKPIVHTKEDALLSAREMKLDAVVIDYQLMLVTELHRMPMADFSSSRPQPATMAS
jgi:carbamoyltransferase